MAISFASFIVGFFAVVPLWASESLLAPHVKIDLLAPQTFSAEKETVIAIRFRPDPRWHVYWKNPGDSGAAPKFSIQTDDADVGPVLWPYPIRLPVAHLTNLGYEGETAYLFEVKPRAGVNSINLEISLEWLVCQEECVPGFGKLTLSRAVDNKASLFASSTETLLRKYTAKIPRTAMDTPIKLKVGEESESEIKMQVILPSTSTDQLDLFPLEPDYILPEQPQIQENPLGLEMVFKKSATAMRPQSLGFLLVADGRAFEFENVVPAIRPVGSKGGEDETWLVILLFSAFVGGVLLNLMPCVFPVLSIKIFSLLKTQTRQQRRKDGLLYSIGVLTTFILLGAGFLLLRQLGASVGWGFQLQSPLVIFSLIVLFWLMALNFLGVFEFGTSLMNTSGQIAWRSSFGTGVLSVFVAAPCTGPFMGTALGATATLSGLSALLVFLFLGGGLAFPYLALTFSETLARALPKPGVWMETLKQFLAFPLLATVLWLLWVLGQQLGTEGWFFTILSMLLLSFCFWLGHRKFMMGKWLAWILAAAVLVGGASKIHRLDFVETVPEKTSAWQPYSDEKLNTALIRGQSVFIDFTAAWCITCQVNKKTVLETASADELFTGAGILRLRADWTKQDPLITQALSRLGRNSVPVYAFYEGGKREPQILPQILTLEMIKNLIPMKEKK